MELNTADKEIFTALRRRQQNRDIPHKPAAILFCGIPGSGKTTLAQRLVRDLHAQYVHNDAARELARQNGIKNFTPHAVSKALTQTIFAEDANKLVVLDATIDTTWRQAIPFFRELNAEPIIIRITIDPAEALARMQRRNREDDPSLAEIIPDRLAKFEACKKELPADIELTALYDYEEVLQLVRQKLMRA